MPKSCFRSNFKKPTRPFRSQTKRTLNQENDVVTGLEAKKRMKEGT